MVHLFYFLALVVSTRCSSLEFGEFDDWTWPGTTWDGLAGGYGHPGWELPVFPVQEVVHNHFHHYPAVLGGQPPLTNGPLYQHLPPHQGHSPSAPYPYTHELGLGGHGSHHHSHLCRYAKKMKHFKKWLAKMIFCD